MSRYKILYSLRENDWELSEEEYETIDIAVKKAVEENKCMRFVIVEVVWDYIS
jgi:hypothetical protein